MAEALAAANRNDEAIRAYGESYRILRSSNFPTKDVFVQSVMGFSGIRFSKILAKKNPAAAERLMEDALEVLRLAAQSPKAGVMQWNDYADSLNGCPYPRLHNKEAALVFAKRAVEASHNGEAMALDTLAWAYYHAGDRARSLETERLALSVATTTGSPIRSLITNHTAVREGRTLIRHRRT